MIMTINDADYNEAKHYRVTEEEAEIIKKFLKLKPVTQSIEDILDNGEVTITFKTDIDIIDF